MAKLAKYQKQARKIYKPQLKAARKQAKSGLRSRMLGLKEQEQTVAPEYEKALRGVDEQLREGEAKINQLYSQRLGGQFSGLQGNDMGMMFSKGAQQRSDLESERATKLSQIAARRSQARKDYQTELSSLGSKYQGLMREYAQSSYDTALQRAEERRQFQQKLNLRRQELAQGGAGGGGGDASDMTLRRNKAGGWEVYEGGKKSSTMDLAGYARATGKDLITLLRQGDAKDRRAAKWYMDKINKYGTEDADKYFQELMRDRPSAFYLGG